MFGWFNYNVYLCTAIEVNKELLSPTQIADNFKKNPCFWSLKTLFSQVKNGVFSQCVHYQRFTKPRENGVFSTERAVGDR